MVHCLLSSLLAKDACDGFATYRHAALFWQGLSAPRPRSASYEKSEAESREQPNRFHEWLKDLPRRIPDIDQLVFAGEFDTTSAQDNDDDDE
jgi:hypothetical protein